MSQPGKSGNSDGRRPTNAPMDRSILETIMENQMAPVIATDELLAAWAVLADAEVPNMKLGGVNWVMIVRSLIAEIKILKSVS